MDDSVSSRPVPAEWSDGGEEAIAAMVEQVEKLHEDEYYDVVGFLMFAGEQQHDAQDAAQTAFEEALGLPARGRWHTVREPRGWIRRVALRRCRRPAGRPADIPRDPTAEAGDQQDASSPYELADLTLDFLDSLRRVAQRSPEASAVLAFDVDGFTDREIAEVLGMKYGKVCDLLKKARALLRENLNGYRPERGDR